ncbi:hypothetical protein PUN28_008476 [Cardiocondyla obscurior]|uniref:Uncharacterized protein n=1 Tax=Cardiocondyla obscurior TaxID=286306 RepID=A0AAW2FZT5_9HYME
MSSAATASSRSSEFVPSRASKIVTREVFVAERGGRRNMQIILPDLPDIAAFRTCEDEGEGGEGEGGPTVEKTSNRRIHLFIDHRVSSRYEPFGKHSPRSRELPRDGTRA